MLSKQQKKINRLYSTVDLLRQCKREIANQRKLLKRDDIVNSLIYNDLIEAHSKLKLIADVLQLWLNANKK